MKPITMSLPFLLLFSASQIPAAEPMKVEATIKSVKPEAKEITVAYKAGTAEKSITLDVSRNAKITIKGESATLDALTPGDKATIEYNKELAVVTEIQAAGELLGGWTFVVFNPTATATADDAFIVSRDGTLVCTSQPGWMLLTNRTFSEMVFSVEFQPPANERSDLGVVMVAAANPTEVNKDRQKRSPIDSIEIKVSPPKCGEMILPRDDFRAELPLGQIRDGRLLTRVRTAEIASGQWHKLEVECNSHGNVTVKLNGELVNAIAKAENISGRIGIWPTKFQFKFRNPTVTIGGKEEKLEFNVTGSIKPK